MEDENLQNLFLEECKQAGFIGVKGYRTVGGVRVSMYNALPLSKCCSNDRPNEVIRCKARIKCLRIK
jgi:hypothetical protein